jgi:anti-sigma B factor antagonist
VDVATLHLRTAGRVVVARLAGELDLSNAANIGAAIQRDLSNDVDAVVVDLTGVTYLDSAAIHQLFRLRERLHERAQRLWLAVDAESPVAATLRLTGVLTAIHAVATVEDALRELGAGGAA